MTTEELARLVRDMRTAQRKYFKDRCAGYLSLAKDAERRVDQAIQEILSPPALSLFDDRQEPTQ